MLHSVLVDERYTLVGANVDGSMRKKIQDGEYIDFARLVPRDKVIMQQEDRLELVNLNGKPSFRSINEGEIINNFGKWEQAFRVFSTIYTDAHPHKAKELIQYNHIIYSTALTWIWSNVYAYDIAFRIHISENPGRNWGIMLEQAWSVRLIERIPHNISMVKNSPAVIDQGSSGGGRSGRKLCWKYNKGNCTYGLNCKFDHKCGICSKFGHGAHNCRKGRPDKQATVFDDNRNGEQRKCRR